MYFRFLFNFSTFAQRFETEIYRVLSLDVGGKPKPEKSKKSNIQTQIHPKNSLFWHDLRNEPKTLSNRQFGGGSLRKLGVFENNIYYDLHIMCFYCRKFLNSTQLKIYVVLLQ